MAVEPPLSPTDTPWDFCWVTLSPGVSSQPVRIPLHRMRLAAKALATFSVRVHEPDNLRTSCRHPNSRSSGGHSAKIRLAFRPPGTIESHQFPPRREGRELRERGQRHYCHRVPTARERRKDRKGPRLQLSPLATERPRPQSMRRQGCS
jgi:hypothetical protein